MSVAVRHGAGWWLAVFIAVLVALSLAAFFATWGWFKLHPVTIVDPPPGILPILVSPMSGGAETEQMRRGRSLAIAGDCVSCHTRPGGKPFAGGLGLRTPFGIIYSSNITGDRATGIGGWSPDQFYSALHRGIGASGAHLYPAMPYPHFTLIPRDDTDAILAYLKTVPGEHYAAPANRLPFPFNIRPVMIVWNALNFTPADFQNKPGQSAEWNRGAYLVTGPAHCGACHTGKTILGAEHRDHVLWGGTIEDQVAPDLTGNSRTGLGRWSMADIAEYLKTGRNQHANAGGLMAEVVTYSTSLMTDQDRLAIATYLKSLGSSDIQNIAPAEDAAMKTGGAIYRDACTACHLSGGRGQPGIFPPLAGSAAVQQQDSTGVVRAILFGKRTAPTLTRPDFPSMPSFAWKLTNQEIADVATYVRNSWSNRAPPVSAQEVEQLRR